MPDAIPKSVKAGSAQEEYRDVRDIRYISELLGGIARVLTPVERAEQIASSTVYVTKRINDHVLWKSALLPWRRSPKWLIVRVALQTTFAAWNLPEEYGYKVFITFVLAKTLELAKDAGVCNDILYVMNAKIAIRMSKMTKIFTSTHLEASPFPVRSISQVISTVELHIRRHWEIVQAVEAQESTWVLPTSAEIDAAKRFALPRCSSHLETARARGLVLSSENTGFDRLSYDQKLEANSRRQSTYTPGVSSPDLWFLVLDIEQRLSSSSFDKGTLSDISDLLTYYDEMALSFKTRNPEIFSRIFLVVLELWMALDRIATQQFPLLSDYSPELSIESFEPLLLPELSQMQRLHNVEIYLAERHTRAEYRHLPVFTFNTDRNSLPSRYFDSDRCLQTLRDTIQAQASNCRREKMQELRTMNAAHAALLEEIRGLTCEYRTWTDRWGCWRSEHAYWCRQVRETEESR
ncbi:hypothetical protein MVEN_01041800 [Mycena venus]|uniref:DUF6606 domain-containing protein n=1 Tax=Mycena venus TaxID=2733690 RepID=A0A8H6YFH5_9AGAR|nr:hypothetical protein MVEN_01041800 [Mycena venus]